MESYSPFTGRLNASWKICSLVVNRQSFLVIDGSLLKSLLVWNRLDKIHESSLFISKPLLLHSSLDFSLDNGYKIIASGNKPKNNDSVYSCLFFFITGLHFFHLLLGLLLLSILFWSSSFGFNITFLNPTSVSSLL